MAALTTVVQKIIRIIIISDLLDVLFELKTTLLLTYCTIPKEVSLAE